MARIGIFVTVTTLPGRREEYLRVWAEHLRDRAAANPGQEVVAVVRDAADPDVVRLFEVFADDDEIRRDAGADWLVAYRRAVEPLLAGPPVVATGEPLWVKG